jgi:DNA-binding GntR family transcriptional regulator
MRSAALRKAGARAGRAARPVAPETLTEQAYRQLEEQIVTLRLEPGEFLSEQVLAQDLAIGRTPIREALQRLAREGLVTILPRKGILVSETDPRKQLLVLEVRRELERLLARLGAQRASDAQRARFRQVADGMDRAARSNDDMAFMRLDRELNLLISEAAHNDYASRAMRFLHGHSRRFWYMHYKAAADLPLCARLHAAEARAIASGDAKRAGEASDRLIDYTETFTRATVGVEARPLRSAGRMRSASG